MATHQVVVLDMPLSDREEVADLERESLPDFTRLVGRSVSCRLKEDVRKINADHLVPETGQCDGLGALATARIEYLERSTQCGQVGRQADD